MSKTKSRASGCGFDTRDEPLDAEVELGGVVDRCDSVGNVAEDWVCLGELVDLTRPVRRR